MFQVALGIRLPVQLHGTDIDVVFRCVPCLYHKALSFGQMQRHAGEGRTAQFVACCARTNGIEPHGREQIPRRHLPGIIISGQATGCILILSLQDMAHSALRFPILPGIVEHIGYLMTRLVAVPIASFAEHGVKLGHIPVTPAHALHQSLGVVGHIPRVMTGSALGNELDKTESIVIVKESTVGMTALCIACAGIYHMPIVLRALHQGLIIGSLAQ